MTFTPSFARVLFASFGFAVLFDIRLILLLSITTDVRKPEPLFYFAMFGIIYIICYVTIFLSNMKSVSVSKKHIIVYHHFEPATKIQWQDIHWADYRQRQCCLWRIFNREGKRVIIPHGTLSLQDEKVLSRYIVQALPEIMLNKPNYKPSSEGHLNRSVA